MLTPPTAELRRKASQHELTQLLETGPAYQLPVVELILLVSPLKLGQVEALTHLFAQFFTLPPVGDLSDEVEYDFIFPGREKLGVTFQRLGMPKTRANSFITLPVESIDVEASVLWPDQILHDRGTCALFPECQQDYARNLLNNSPAGMHASVFTRFKATPRNAHLHDLFQHVDLGRWLNTRKASMKAPT